MSPATVVCFGEALWDVTPDGRLPGGAPMNVALRLASQGIETRLLSRVGDDESGRELLAYLAGRGLDTRYVQVDSIYPTGRVNVDTSDRQAVRYDIVTPSAWDFIDARQYLAAAGSSGGPVVFGSLIARSEVSRRSLLDILDRSTLAVFDVNLRPPYDDRETIEGLLQRADWVKLNETELALICAWCGAGADTESAMPAVAAHYSIDVLCVTRGRDGAVMLRDGRLHRQAAFAVDVVDTIGCGDAFLGTWLAELLGGSDAGRALSRAAAVGAIVAAHAGANAPVSEAMIRRLTG